MLVQKGCRTEHFLSNTDRNILVFPNLTHFAAKRSNPVLFFVSFLMFGQVFRIYYLHEVFVYHLTYSFFIHFETYSFLRCNSLISNSFLFDTTRTISSATLICDSYFPSTFVPFCFHVNFLKTFFNTGEQLWKLRAPLSIPVLPQYGEDYNAVALFYNTTQRPAETIGSIYLQTVRRLWRR